MKLEVEFDNYDYDEEEYVTLKPSDLILTLPNHGSIMPIGMFDGCHATYELPDGATEDDLIAALEGSIWQYTQISDVEAPELPAPQ